MSELQIPRETAEGLLQQDPDPVVRFRLLRDVLGRAKDDSDLVQSKADVERSCWVRQLAHEQWEDGSWGRLHSQDCSVSQRIPTTEAGVERALALGLDAEHPILRRAASYLTGLLKGLYPCLDRPESNDRWQAGVELFAASTLAKIDPTLPVLDGPWALWRDVARRTFSSGSYDAYAEAAAQRVGTGASVSGSYLVVGSKYALSLLAGRVEQLAPALEAAIIRWIWNKPDGIGYLCEPVSQPPRATKAGTIDCWLASHELLAGLPTWRLLAGRAVCWLWGQCDEQGGWDFGPRLSFSATLPLSESWRRRGARRMDWSTRILTLLQRYHGPAAAEHGVPLELVQLSSAPPSEACFRIIRRLRLAHCKKGPSRCEECREMNQERICLLSVCATGSGLAQRRVIKLTIDGETTYREYDIVRTFEGEDEALAYAAEHGLEDVEL